MSEVGLLAPTIDVVQPPPADADDFIKHDLNMIVIDVATEKRQKNK